MSVKLQLTDKQAEMVLTALRSTRDHWAETKNGSLMRQMREVAAAQEASYEALLEHCVEQIDPFEGEGDPLDVGGEP